MLSFQIPHVCPFGPGGHSDGKDHTFQCRRWLQLHLLSVHQCDLVKDSTSSRDRTVRVSAECAEAKLFGWLRPKECHQYLHLQQPLKDAAIDGIVSSITDAVETSVSSQPGEHSSLSSSSY